MKMGRSGEEQGAVVRRGGGGGENERCERDNWLAQVVVTGEGEGIKRPREQICDRWFTSLYASLAFQN